MEAVRVALKLGNDRRGHGRFGPYAVSPDDEILIGRSALNGLGLQEPWTPRVLARLVPTGGYWLLVNGPSGDVEIRNTWVQVTKRQRAVGKGESRTVKSVSTGTIFRKNAAIALPPGKTEAEWSIFQDNIRLAITVGGDVEGLAMLEPEDGRLIRIGATTLHGPGRQRSYGATTALRNSENSSPLLTARQRHVMAVVFRHLLEDQPRPRDLALTAAESLGMTKDAVKKHIRDVKKRVNAERDAWDFANLDELGEWLVNKTATVTPADLAEFPSAIEALEELIDRPRTSDPTP